MADEPKPGFKTTEGIGAAGIVGALLAFRQQFPDVPDELIGWWIVILGVAYILSRTIVKWRPYQTNYEMRVETLEDIVQELRKLKK